jgi:hypothetical protein
VQRKRHYGKPQLRPVIDHGHAIVLIGDDEIAGINPTAEIGNDNVAPTPVGQASGNSHPCVRAQYCNRWKLAAGSGENLGVTNSESLLRTRRKRQREKERNQKNPL